MDANAKSASAGEASALRYRSLDTWRGIAALMVVVFHGGAEAAIFTGAAQDSSWIRRFAGNALLHADVGVLLFFVVSGYCIAACADAYKGSQPKGMLEFLRRRFRRIYFPFWAAMLLGILLSLDFYPHVVISNCLAAFDLPADQWLGNLTLTETWRPFLFGGESNLVLGHAWSLCYEIQFYILVAVMLWLGRGLFWSSLVLSGLTLALMFVSLLNGQLYGFRLFWDGQWFHFASGIYVYYVLRYHGQNRCLWSTLSLVAAITLALLSCTASGRIFQFPFLGITLAFGTLLIILYGDDERLCAARALKPLMFCGKISYSLYLVHPLVCPIVKTSLYQLGFTGLWDTVFLVIPCCMLASVLVAYGFYQIVERHFLGSTRKVAVSQPSHQNLELLRPRQEAQG